MIAKDRNKTIYSELRFKEFTKPNSSLTYFPFCRILVQCYKMVTDKLKARRKKEMFSHFCKNTFCTSKLYAFFQKYLRHFATAILM